MAAGTLGILTEGWLWMSGGGEQTQALLCSGGRGTCPYVGMGNGETYVRGLD